MSPKFPMDNEQLNEQFGELYEKYDALGNEQLIGSAMKGAMEAKRFAKSHRMLIPYLHACFSVTNFSQSLFEPEIGADHALEIIALVESEEKARKFQHDYDEDHYQYTVHWISACAYDNLAKHTAARNGYNSPVVHGAVDDGIHVCRRTGKLECVDCFREYAVEICYASGDYEMGEHYARLCATSQNTQNTSDRRYNGYEDLILLSILRGRFSAGLELLKKAIPFIELYGDPKEAGFELAHRAELLCLLSGREQDLPSLMDEMGHGGSMPEIPSRDENPLHHLNQTINEAARCTCRNDFVGAEKILAEEERFLLGQQTLSRWFGIRVQRIASLLLADEAGMTLDVNVDSLAEELRRRASKACEWSTISALDTMLQRRVRLNPLGIAFPIDIGPYATEGTPISISPLNLALPLVEKSDVAQPEKDAEKPEKSAFELEIDGWLASLEPLWTALAEHEQRQHQLYHQHQQQGQSSEFRPEPFPQTEELEKRERDVFEKIVQITPKTQTGPNGEEITEAEFLASTAPLTRMSLLRNLDRAGECWSWFKRMQKNFPDRGRPLSTLAYHGFLFRNRAEEQNVDFVALDLPSNEELEQWISKAFELEPNRAGIATVAGMIFRAHGNSREAQRYFSRANQIDRVNEFAAVSLAELYEEADRPKDAMATIELYTRAGGRHPGLLWEGMQIAFRNEMPQEFLLYFDAYHETQPSYPMLDAQRIWALCVLERFNEALAMLDVLDGQVNEPGKDRLFLRALCQAELGDAAWIETFEEAMKCNGETTLIGIAYDPCQRLWSHVKKLSEVDARRDDFVRFLFERGIVPDDVFMPDDEKNEEETTEEPPVKGYFRCILRQPLIPDVPAYAGWIRLSDTAYLAIWLVLADDEEEAGRLALEAQTRCYPTSAELLEIEQLNSYYAQKSQVVGQGKRFQPTSDNDD